MFTNLTSPKRTDESTGRILTPDRENIQGADLTKRNVPKNPDITDESSSLLNPDNGKLQLIIEKNARKNIKALCYGLIIFEVLMVILYGIFNYSTVGEVYDDTTTDLTIMYFRYTSVLIMILFGFGFNSIYSADGAISNIGFTLLITTTVSQLAFLSDNLCSAIYNNSFGVDGSLQFNIYGLESAAYAAMACVIALTAYGNSLTPVDMLIVSCILTIGYSVNSQIAMNYFNLVDPGQIYNIHLFAAFFSLSFSWYASFPKLPYQFKHEVTSELMYLGTLFLYIFWPNFVSGSYTANSEESQRGYVNTYTCITASTITSFCVAFLIDNATKIRIFDVRNAIVSGGISVGSIATLQVSSYIIIFIGVVSAFITITSNTRIGPYLLRNYSIIDSAGVLGTHGMCGIFGAIVSVFVAAYKASYDMSDVSIYGSDYADQWWRQLVAMFVCIGIALLFGLLAGITYEFVTKTMRIKIADDDDDDDNDQLVPNNAKDNLYWEKLSESAKKFRYIE